MPADWKSIENIERLCAAIIASNGGKVDNQAVARYFNETFDAIENRTRLYKKAAQKLVEEAEAAGRMDQNMKKSAAGGSKKSTATPKKGTAATPDSAAVKSGRVTKRAPKTPSKLKRAETDDEDEDEEMTGTAPAVKDEEV
ncbi:hypothetical protein M436DRAFT_48053 [Aureobasidium namibiae CBS 147.97]|uniref:Uncharacterized protein n=1 Tax=Aureobasidium namibiae CBS 147.97 TaxID=1043004 RepID=A0A074XCQ4_9PEZI